MDDFFDDDEIDDIFNQPIEVDPQEQVIALNRKIVELSVFIRVQNERIADLVHENRTLKNNINAYIKKITN